ncbi:hypothetical protein P3T43_000643 [Paraburkholderia sp. GAS41]
MLTAPKSAARITSAQPWAGDAGDFALLDPQRSHRRLEAMRKV